MKIRIIQKPQYQILCHLQVKKWWHLGWQDVCADDYERVKKLADDMVKHGQPYHILFEVEMK